MKRIAELYETPGYVPPASILRWRARHRAKTAFLEAQREVARLERDLEQKRKQLARARTRAIMGDLLE